MYTNNVFTTLQVFTMLHIFTLLNLRIYMKISAGRIFFIMGNNTNGFRVTDLSVGKIIQNVTLSMT